MQAVSTANLELAVYGTCFLDHIKDYKQILKYFRGLNSIASAAVHAVITEKEQQNNTAYVKTIAKKSCGEIVDGVVLEATEIAVRAAIRLYAPNQDCADRAFAHCKWLLKR